MLQINGPGHVKRIGPAVEQDKLPSDLHPMPIDLLIDVGCIIPYSTPSPPKPIRNEASSATDKPSMPS
jgi:hypothetical protein